LGLILISLKMLGGLASSNFIFGGERIGELVDADAPFCKQKQNVFGFCFD